MAYRLKRPVEITVRWIEEHWAPRCLVPACWHAQIVAGGPKTMGGVGAQGPTRAAAIKVIIDRLRSAGYSGTAKVEGGWNARPPRA